MADLNALAQVIEGSGIKKQKIADVLGISKQGLANKLAGRAPFQLAEIRPLCDLLGLSDAQRDDIFLS